MINAIIVTTSVILFILYRRGFEEKVIPIGILFCAGIFFLFGIKGIFFPQGWDFATITEYNLIITQEFIMGLGFLLLSFMMLFLVFSQNKRDNSIGIV